MSENYFSAKIQKRVSIVVSIFIIFLILKIKNISKTFALPLFLLSFLTENKKVFNNNYFTEK